MKKSLLALAALTAFAGVASAQSSVTLFGVVDLSARFVEYGSTSQYQLATDGNASSRLGVRGVEDLGGGLKAGFWVEGSLVPDDGNASGMTWQRRSTVSLMGGFGEVRLGRDYTPTFWGFASYDPFGTNGVGSAANIFLETAGLVPGGSYGTLVRANNTVGYHLPAMGGLFGQVMVSAGEGTMGNKYMGGRIGYAAGPFNASVAYGETQVTPAIDGTVMTFGASFNMGFMSLSGAYSKLEVGSVNQDNYFVGVTAPMGPFTLKASYGNVERSGSTVAAAANGDATQIAIGATYDLSKRTALYGTYSTIDNNGTRFRAGQLQTTAAQAAYTTVGRDATGYEFGVRHSF